MKKLALILIVFFGCTHPDSPEKPDASEEVVSEQDSLDQQPDTSDSDS